MSNRKVTPFELTQAMDKLTSESIFDKLVKEVDASEIPAQYVEYVAVQYKDGNTVELTGSEIANPIPINKDASWSDMEPTFKKVKSVKVFIDTKKLEEDVTVRIDQLLKNKLL